MCMCAHACTCIGCYYDEETLWPRQLIKETMGLMIPESSRVHDHQGREHGSTQQAGRDVSAAVADSSHLETQPRGTESWQKWPESFETSKSIYTQWHTSSNKVASTNPSQTIPPSIQTYKPMETILIQITIATNYSTGFILIKVTSTDIDHIYELKPTANEDSK